MTSLRTPAFIGDLVSTNDPCQPTSTIIGESINVRVNYLSLATVGGLVATHLSWVPVANACLPIVQPIIVGSGDSIASTVRVNYRTSARVGDLTSPKFGRILTGKVTSVKFG